MESKPWYQSSTLWVNVAIAVYQAVKAVFVAQGVVTNETLPNISPELVTMLNIALRFKSKQPVTVKLTRKVTGDTFEFRGQITIGQKVLLYPRSTNPATP